MERYGYAQLSASKEVERRDGCKRVRCVQYVVRAHGT